MISESTKDKIANAINAATIKVLWSILLFVGTNCLILLVWWVWSYPKEWAVVVGISVVFWACHWASERVRKSSDVGEKL